MTMGNLPNLTQQVSLSPVQSISGTSVNYTNYLNESWVPGHQANGAWFNRSNATVAMTDSLPNPANAMGSISKLPNGWLIRINNTDASASITLTPTGCTINGASSLTITAGHVSTIITDGTNYFSATSPN